MPHERGAFGDCGRASREDAAWIGGMDRQALPGLGDPLQRAGSGRCAHERGLQRVRELIKLIEAGGREHQLPSRALYAPPLLMPESCRHAKATL